ncbi:MAG: hypothetical protein H0V41_07180 [Pseudonocardiales bacterium]|nr:hypothetical protein [Pseudonocardiales bacterium]
MAALEKERRRLRRDLHDGLGPALTGMAFAADATGNLLRTEPDRAAELIVALRRSATEAIDDVRRLVYALRPPALDELGLVGRCAGRPTSSAPAVASRRSKWTLPSHCRRCRPPSRSPPTGSRWRH